MRTETWAGLGGYSLQKTRLDRRNISD